MAKRLRALGLLCALLALVLACHLAAPALYAAEDKTLLAGYLPRRRLEGRLSADALDIFLVRRLHERAGDPTYNGYFREETDPSEAEALLRARLEECAPVLGEEVTAALKPMLDAENATYTFAKDSYDFWQCLCDFGGGMLGVEYDPLSGAIVRFWVQSRLYMAQGASAQRLAAYREMLALEGLDGWQTGQGYYDATLTNEGAGLMLYLYNKDGVFQLGAEVVSGRDADEPPAAG